MKIKELNSHWEVRTGKDNRLIATLYGSYVEVVEKYEGLPVKISEVRTLVPLNRLIRTR